MAGTADRIARAHAEKRDLAAFEAARTPAPGALTPRRRIEQLIDPGSLFEIGALTRSQLPAIEDATPGDGVVAGFADVGGRLVGVIADDPVIMARSDGGVGTNKRLRIVQQSLAGGVAIAYLADAALPAQFPAAAEGLLRRGGSDRASVVPELRLEERQAPLIAVVLGGLEGADTGLLAAADLTIAGGAASAATRAIADIAVADDAAAIAAARRCLALLPHDGEDDLRRDAAPPDGRFADEVDPATLSIADLLAGLLDDGSHFPIHAAPDGKFATGLGVIEGTLTAYAAAGPRLGLTRAHVKPLLHIARLRRQFRIPILLIQHGAAYDPDALADPETLRDIATAGNHLREADAPLLSLIVSRGYVFGDWLLGGEELGRHYVGAWAQADVATGPVPAYTTTAASADDGRGPFATAAAGAIDDVMLPTETRDHVGRMLRWTAQMRTFPPPHADHQGRILTRLK